MAVSRGDEFGALFDASPDAIVVVDADGRVELVSRSVETMFGYQADELIGKPIEILIPEDRWGTHEADRRSYFDRPVARAMGTGLDLAGRRKDGSTFPVDVSLAPVTGRSVRVGAFVRDATERRRAETILRHVNEISVQLLASSDTTRTLGLIAHRARQLASGIAAWLVLRDRPGVLVVAAADGEGADTLLATELSDESTLSARTMAEGVPLSVGNMTTDPAVFPPGRRIGAGPGLYVPMLAENGAIGTLVMARAQGAAHFDARDIRILEAFAGAASVALSLGRARREVEDLRVVSEHERIARDLHDTVMQRLYALGMSLQGLQRLTDGVVGERIGTAVDAIDLVIREIRETVFDLNRPDPSGPNVRARLREVAAQATMQLGFEPTLSFRGPVEAGVDEEVIGHLLSVAREALSNIARHAQAQSAVLGLSASDGFLTLTIADDGIGMPSEPSAGNGLRNMTKRAERFAGSVDIVRRDVGTLIEWRIPVTD